jgi:hypothetical protein
MGRIHFEPARLATVDARCWRRRSRWKRLVEQIAVIFVKELRILEVRHRCPLMPHLAWQYVGTLGVCAYMVMGFPIDRGQDFAYYGGCQGHHNPV